MKKHWIFATQETSLVPTEEDQKYAEQLGVSWLIVRLLRQRGLKSLQEMNVFLSPNLRYLAIPEAWSGISEAAEILEKAVLDRKKIAVWGDYDVDGITASTLVLEFFAFHGVNVSVHLPNRLSEGYGVNLNGVEKLAADGIQVLLTVDCGISDVEAVARAKELGLTVVLSDHHTPPENLPKADAIINPKLLDKDNLHNPYANLAGVGVAFYLMAALNTRLATHTQRHMDMRNVLDLVALGTIADIVPLTGQNRILVKNGLLKISEAKRPGLAALKMVCGFSSVASVGSTQVAYQMGPRLNAAGRLGSPTLAQNLLLAHSYEEAGRLARELNILNGQRREIEERIYEEAFNQAKDAYDKAGFVLYDQNWHPGVIGIVASRIVEAFNRPVLILGQDKDATQLKGSGRSVDGFNLYDGLCQCADLLTTFGGHQRAGGLQLSIQNLPALRERFDQIVCKNLGTNVELSHLDIDGELSFTYASNFPFLKSLDLLQPFGEANQEPVFASSSLLVRRYRTFGSTKNHVSLDVIEEASGISMQAKVWRAATEISSAIAGHRIRIAFTPGINAYNGISSIELNVKDLDILQ